MDPRDEMYINRYRLDEKRFLETIRPRHDMYTDVWICEFASNIKRFVTSVNTKDKDWMDRVAELI